MFEVRGKEEEVLICLQQEDRRIWRKEGGGENLPIGFEVLKVSRVPNEPTPSKLKFKNTFPAASTGGGEPLQPGAGFSGAGGQLRVHRLPQRDAQRSFESGPLRCAAHHLPAGSHWPLPASTLLPFLHPTQVCYRARCRQ